MPDPSSIALHSEWTTLAIESNRVDLKLNQENGQKALFAKRRFIANESIVEIASSVIYKSPSYLTIQIGDAQHIAIEPEYLQFLNHSCDPNCFPDFDQRKLIALKKIEVGEELRYFYPSTEWSMDRPFLCNCESDRCLSMINGAKYLPMETLSKYQISSYILTKKSESANF